MKKAPVRVGILGCEPISQAAHLEAALKARNAELYAVCDVAKDLGQKIAARFEPRETFSNYDAMLADPERVAGLILVRPAWLDRPFPLNLRWFPIAGRLLQEYSADKAARRFQLMPEFLELRAASPPAADSLLGQFHRPYARERAGILVGMPASVPVPSLSHCQQLQVPGQVVVNPRDPVHPDILGEQLTAAMPGAALSRITSKTESEVLHKTDLARVLNDSLKALKQA